MLDDETLLLEYALGEEKSFVWAVTPTSIKSFELPKRAEIEVGARRLFGMLTARNTLASKETPEQRHRRVALAEADYPTASAVLSEMLLGPVRSELGTKRLLIVSDGCCSTCHSQRCPCQPGSNSPVCHRLLLRGRQEAKVKETKTGH